MNSNAGHSEPFYLDGRHGRIFAVWHSPVHSTTQALLHVPAFGEEMNKSRRMVALLAQALRDRGIATLLVDPSGTGDSEGELCDASWERWKDDLRTAHSWLRNQGVSDIVLWGHRLGALLAADLVHEFEDVRRLLLWNPVPSGGRFLTQFLRLRAASSMMRGERETAKQLREQLRTRGTIEVAGYVLPEALAAPVESLKLIDHPPPASIETAWFDVSATDGNQLGAAASKTVAAWQAGGCTVSASVLPGEPFWSTQEIALAPALIDESLSFIDQGDAAATQVIVTTPAVDEHTAPTTDTRERAVRFTCEGQSLFGVLHPCSEDSTSAVLVVVGGPQYRVGSHRQFVQLTRTLAENGIPSLRFDYRGMGDSEGPARDFEDIQADIRAALDVLCAECPAVREVTLWGLCDGASAACFYAGTDPRVKRLVLLNPWVTTAQGQARAYITYYYVTRLFSRQFWLKLLRGDVHVYAAAAEFVGKLLRAVRGERQDSDAFASAATNTPSTSGNTNEAFEAAAQAPRIAAANKASTRTALPERMARGLEKFDGKILFLLSGDDLTAEEFRSESRRSRRWRTIMRAPDTTTIDFPRADHTFSDPQQSAAASRATLDFVIAS